MMATLTKRSATLVASALRGQALIYQGLGEQNEDVDNDLEST